jgi:heme-degrading monooxygenase HmoA
LRPYVNKLNGLITRQLQKGGSVMFARVTIVQIKEGKVGEAVNIYQDNVVPAAKSQKGYKGTYLFTDHSTGKGMAITIWDTEEDAVANEQSGYYQEQVGRFQDIFKAPPDREGYDVSVQG